jgi:REP element-mobilizing transposase RayT
MQQAGLVGFMVGYRRNFVPGGTYFFTVTLADRRSNALVDHIGALRGAFAQLGASVHSRSTRS